MSEPCAECGRTSPTSPSDYFCSDACQQHWYAKQTMGQWIDPEPQVPSQLAQVARGWRAA
jgi:endogenous inhibitor of DNA gyrase (YacG/DUF329 family)